MLNAKCYMLNVPAGLKPKKRTQTHCNCRVCNCRVESIKQGAAIIKVWWMHVCTDASANFHLHPFHMWHSAALTEESLNCAPGGCVNCKALL